MHVDFRNTLKFFLYAKNGIWENKDIALMQLEFVFEGYFYNIYKYFYIINKNL